MHQLASPPLDRDVLRKIESDSLKQQVRLMSVAVPKEHRRPGWLFWALAVLALAAIGALVALLSSGAVG